MGKFSKAFASKLAPTMPQMNKMQVIDPKKKKKQTLKVSPLMKAFGK